MDGSPLSGLVSSKRTLELRHGVNNHTIIGKCQHLLSDSIEVAFDLLLLDITDRNKLIPGLLLNRLPAALVGLVSQGSADQDDRYYRQGNTYENQFVLERHRGFL